MGLSWPGGGVVALVGGHDPQFADGRVAGAGDHVGDAVGDVLGGKDLGLLVEGVVSGRGSRACCASPVLWSRSPLRIVGAESEVFTSELCGIETGRSLRTGQLGQTNPTIRQRRRSSRLWRSREGHRVCVLYSFGVLSPAVTAEFNVSCHRRARRGGRTGLARHHGLAAARIRGRRGRATARSGLVIVGDG